MNKAQERELYFSVEKIISAIEKCHLHKEQRERVSNTTSNFRQTFIRLSKTKKTKPKKAYGYGQ